jgi:hypothetical protein
MFVAIENFAAMSRIFPKLDFSQNFSISLPMVSGK